MRQFFIILFFFGIGNGLCSAQKTKFISYATSTLEAIYKHYGVEGNVLLRENYPFRGDFRADYLGVEAEKTQANSFSYLWPYSGMLSAYVALLETTKSREWVKAIDQNVLTGLQAYYDDKREPKAYASYINSAPQSDRFYDDNIWIGIDFTDLYLLTKKKVYLEQALEVWRFVESGMDDKLGGGIYWCEQRKESKNTCSNAPAIVFLAKLYIATKEEKYLTLAKSLYQWVQNQLLDPSDSVYYDNINLRGQLDRRKFAYNSGQMIQAGALLYKISKEKQYLTDAQRIAKGAYSYFFHPIAESDSMQSFRYLRKSNNWFIAVMMRGYVELYAIDGNSLYVDTFRKNLDNAWDHMREAQGLFHKDWSGKEKDKRFWLLDQLAMVEMYARIAGIR